MHCSFYENMDSFLSQLLSLLNAAHKLNKLLQETPQLLAVFPKNQKVQYGQKEF